MASRYPPPSPSRMQGSPNSAAWRGGSRTSNDNHRMHAVDTPIRSNDGNQNKEGIVQKLQRVLVAVRRERDREHRSRDIALEKLRAAKEAFHFEKSAFDEDLTKLKRTREDSEATLNDISAMESRILNLQRTYQFQHEDLLRKREKIRHQTDALEATSIRHEKSLQDARKRLESQRDKKQESKRKEAAEAENLIKTIVTEAIIKKQQQDGMRTSDNVKQNITPHSSEKEHTRFPQYNVRLRSKEVLEKKQEEFLALEFKTMIDYTMLPILILKKANTLNERCEILKADIARLESMNSESLRAEISRLGIIPLTDDCHLSGNKSDLSIIPRHSETDRETHSESQSGSENKILYENEQEANGPSRVEFENIMDSGGPMTLPTKGKHEKDGSGFAGDIGEGQGKKGATGANLEDLISAQEKDEQLYELMPDIGENIEMDFDNDDEMGDTKTDLMVDEYSGTCNVENSEFPNLSRNMGIECKGLEHPIGHLANDGEGSGVDLSAQTSRSKNKNIGYECHNGNVEEANGDKDGIFEGTKGNNGETGALSDCVGDNIANITCAAQEGAKK